MGTSMNNKLKDSFIDSIDVLKASFDEYTKNAVLQSIFSLEGNTLANFSPNKKYITIIEINSNIEKNKNLLDSILNNYADYLKSMSPQLRAAKIDKINNWCSFYFVFKTLNNLNYKHVVFFEQLIFEMSQTKKVFDKYINLKIGQDWGSLDVNDNVLVFYDLYKYMCEIPSETQIQIISDYSEKIIKINKTH